MSGIQNMAFEPSDQKASKFYHYKIQDAISRNKTIRQIDTLR